MRHHFRVYTFERRKWLRHWMKRLASKPQSKRSSPQKLSLCKKKRKGILSGLSSKITCGSVCTKRRLVSCVISLASFWRLTFTMSRSVTCVNFFGPGTCITLDWTTPLKATVASLVHYFFATLKSSSTTHCFASIGSFRCWTTGSASGAQLSIHRTVVRRRVQVNKVFGSWNSSPSIPDLKFSSLVDLDFCSCIVSILQ